MKDKIQSQSKLILTLLTLVTLTLYAWRVLIPAARANYSLPVFYTAAFIQWHTPAEMLHLYDDSWLNDQMVNLGFTHTWDVYRPNPPTMTLFFLPFLAIPVQWTSFVWVGVNLLALIGSLALSAAALGIPSHRSLWVLPLVLLSQPVLHHFARGQLYFPVLLGLSLCFWGLARRHEAWAGFALGLIMVSKTAAAWLFLLLLVARRWRVVGWAVATAVPFILISLLWDGLSPWLTYLSMLSERMSDPSRVVTAYQTITSLFGHLFILESTWNPTPIFHLPWLATTLTLLTFVGTLYLSWRYGRLDNGAAQEARLLTTALWCALIVSNAPLAEDYHYVLLLPSLGTAVWWATKTGHRKLPLLIAILLLALPLPFKHPLLAQSWLALFAYPRVYGAYLLWGWLLWQLQRLQTAPQRPTDTLPTIHS
ncbi:MAG: DUF2029 domain-containing protein [Anaerolineales bacterium]|nr:DUF2029 domain-containing protein [Anaerolineales bacterium]